MYIVSLTSDIKDMRRRFIHGRAEHTVDTESFPKALSIPVPQPYSTIEDELESYRRPAAVKGLVACRIREFR